MTDEPNDDGDDIALGAQLKQMQAIFDEAIDTDVTLKAIDFMCRARLLIDIADVNVAKDVIHKPGGREAAEREWAEIPSEKREAVAQEVMDHWAMCTTQAVKRLYHAAAVLGFQPDTLDPKHVALTAATYLSQRATELHETQDEAA